VHALHRDGSSRVTIPRGAAAYEPNTLANGAELRADGGRQGFQPLADALESPKLRRRSASFDDHFSQASLFWASQGPIEKENITRAFQRELWQVRAPNIRQSVVDNLAHVDARLARRVAHALGIAAPDAKAAAGRAGFRERRQKLPLETAPSMNIERGPSRSIATRRVAVLVAPGVEVGALRAIQQVLEDADALCCLLAERVGSVATASGQQLAVEHTICGRPSVLFDALLLPGGAASVLALAACGPAVSFVIEAYRHGKPICVIGEGLQLLSPLGLADAQTAAAVPGIVVGRNDPHQRTQLAHDFAAAIAAHRHWARPDLEGAAP
jgi:catalase